MKHILLLELITYREKYRIVWQKMPPFLELDKASGISYTNYTKVEYTNEKNISNKNITFLPKIKI